MELDFEVFHRPGKYHDAADAIPRLSKKAFGEENSNTDVNDDVSAYCIVGHISDPNLVSKKNGDIVEPLPTAKEIMDAKQTVCYAKISKKYRRKRGRYPSKKMSSSAEKRLLMKQYKFLFLNDTREHCSTEGIAQHWLDIMEQKAMYGVFSRTY